MDFYQPAGEGQNGLRKYGRITLIKFYKLKNGVKDRLRPYWWQLKRQVDFLVLLAARGLSAVSRSNALRPENLYPPKELCRSSRQWMAMYGHKIGAEFVAVDPACIVAHDLPKTIHATIRQQLSMDLQYSWPATFVITIPGGRSRSSGYIVTPDDRMLDDLSIDFRAQRWSLRPQTASIVRYWNFKEMVEYDGRVAVLSTDAAEIYYHWFFQLLPRYELLRRAGIDLETIDYFVVNDLSKAFQRDSVQALGIPPNKIIESSKTPYFRARQLVVPSIPIGSGCFRPWMTQFLRRTFLAGSLRQPQTRRVYISRGLASYRRVANENEVVCLLRSFGFEELRLEGLSMMKQAETIASCEAVVAPHGAGLCNIVFCEPGTKVIEIFSPELVTGFYWKLASQLHFDYYYILGKGSPDSQEENYFQSWNAGADIIVDLLTLQKTLKLAGLGRM